MPFNGSGTFLRVMDWEADRDSGIKIRADRHDAEDDNFAAGLSNTLTKDGQTQPVANIPMNGKKLVNLGTPTVGTDAATKTYVDSIKKFTNDIEVTDEVIFKDGTVTRGYIKGTIGAGVAASMIFETDNDAGTIVNRMTLDSTGLNLRTGQYRLTPGDILRGSMTAATGASPEINLRTFDAAGAASSMFTAGSIYAYLWVLDPAATGASFQFRESDNSQRAVITADYAATDGKLTIDIRNGSATVRNSIVLDINGATLMTGKFVAPAWEFLDNKATIDGNVYVGTTSNFIQFTGTTADVQSPILRIRDNRTTTTSVGNAVLSIKRQNSSTDAMIFGNDANHAGLIGGNNTPLRFGKWVGGVFTEYMNITTGAYINAAANIVVDSPNGAGGINILPTDGSSGRLFWNSTTHTWATCVDETEGTLKFLSGGVFASSTGTIRFRMYENGDFLAGGKGSMTELQVDPASAVTGIRLLPSDTNSGRLFLEATTKKWALSAWESSGALSFTSGGTYGSATGTTRMTLLEDGQLETSGEMNAAFSVRVTRGFGTVTRGMLYVSSSGQMELNKVDVDGTTYTNRLLMGTNVASFIAAAAATSYTFRLANGSAQRRIDLFFSATNPLALVARDATDDSLFCSLTANTSGVPFWTYRTGTAAEMVTTATLNLTCYTGSTQDETNFPVGHTVIARGGTTPGRNQTGTVRLGTIAQEYRYDGSGTALAGTWRARGYFDDAEGGLSGALFQRTA